MPRVSVVICCYNLGRYLDEALDSVLAQTMQDFEIIVINPSSTDGFTNRLLADYKRPKTRVMHTPFMSVSESRNLGIAKSMGPYICCLDADDLLEPTYLEKACAVLDREAGVGFAGCWYEAFGADSWSHTPASWTIEDFLVENRAPVASVFRKEAWRGVGGYDEKLLGYEDWEFWISLLGAGHACHIIPEILFRYRVRADSKIKTSNAPANRGVIMEIIIRKHERAFRENLIPVLIYKERLLGELADWTKKQDEAKQWFLRRDREHERYIKELEDDVRGRRVRAAELRRQSVARNRERHAAEIMALQHRLDLLQNELNLIRLSKQWKLSAAILDARRSPRALMKLPFSMLRIALGG